MSAENVSSYLFEQLESSAELSRSPADLIAAAEAIRERARSEGEAAGYAAGTERAERELVALTDALTATLTDAALQLAASRDELVERLTRQAGEISLAVAEQVVAGAFEVSPEIVIDVTREAIRRLADRHRVTVLVSAADVTRISESLERLRGEAGGVDFIEVRADARVSGSGAIVETEYGEIDASVKTQIENARRLVATGLVGDGAASGHEIEDADDAI